MDLLDYIFPADYSKVLHEVHLNLDYRIVKTKFEDLFGINKLPSMKLHYTFNEKLNTYIIKSGDFDCEQLVHIYFRAKYLNVYQYVKLPVKIIKTINKMQATGEMTIKQVYDYMGLMTEIIVVRKVLEQAINEVKNNI